MSCIKVVTGVSLNISAEPCKKALLLGRNNDHLPKIWHLPFWNIVVMILLRYVKLFTSCYIMPKFFHRKTAWIFTQLIPYWTARVRTTVKLLVSSDHVLFFHKLTHYVKLWRDQSSALKQIHTAIKIIKKTSNTQNQLKRNFQYTVFAVRKGENFYPCYCTKLGITQNFLSEYNGHIQNTSFKPSFFFFFHF